MSKHDSEIMPSGQLSKFWGLSPKFSLPHASAYANFLFREEKSHENETDVVGGRGVLPRD